MKEATEAPRRLVGQPDVPDLPALHQIRECLQGFLNRDARFLVDVCVAKTPEKVCRSLWPVQLIQVDVVGLEPPQTFVNGSEDVVTIELILAVSEVVGVENPRRAGDLGGEDHLGTLPGFLEP